MKFLCRLRDDSVIQPIGIVLSVLFLSPLHEFGVELLDAFLKQIELGPVALIILVEFTLHPPLLDGDVFHLRLQCIQSLLKLIVHIFELSKLVIDGADEILRLDVFGLFFGDGFLKTRDGLVALQRLLLALLLQTFGFQFLLLLSIDLPLFATVFNLELRRHGGFLCDFLLLLLLLFLCFALDVPGVLFAQRSDASIVMLVVFLFLLTHQGSSRTRKPSPRRERVSSLGSLGAKHHLFVVVVVVFIFVVTRFFVVFVVFVATRFFLLDFVASRLPLFLSRLTARSKHLFLGLLLGLLLFANFIASALALGCGVFGRFTLLIVSRLAHVSAFAVVAFACLLAHLTRLDEGFCAFLEHLLVRALLVANFIASALARGGGIFIGGVALATADVGVIVLISTLRMIVRLLCLLTFAFLEFSRLQSLSNFRARSLALLGGIRVGGDSRLALRYGVRQSLRSGRASGQMPLRYRADERQSFLSLLLNEFDAFIRRVHELRDVLLRLVRRLLRSLLFGRLTKRRGRLLHALTNLLNQLFGIV